MGRLAREIVRRTILRGPMTDDGRLRTKDGRRIADRPFDRLFGKLTTGSQQAQDRVHPPSPNGLRWAGGSKFMVYG